MAISGARPDAVLAADRVSADVATTGSTRSIWPATCLLGSPAGHPRKPRSPRSSERPSLERAAQRLTAPRAAAPPKPWPGCGTRRSTRAMKECRSSLAYAVKEGFDRCWSAPAMMRTLVQGGPNRKAAALPRTWLCCDASSISDLYAHRCHGWNSRSVSQAARSRPPTSDRDRAGRRSAGPEPRLLDYGAGATRSAKTTMLST